MAEKKGSIVACSLSREIPKHLILEDTARSNCGSCGEEILISRSSLIFVEKMGATAMCMKCAEKELPHIDAIVLPPREEVDRVKDADEEHERRN